MIGSRGQDIGALREKVKRDGGSGTSEGIRPDILATATSVRIRVYGQLGCGKSGKSKAESKVEQGNERHS